MDVYPCLEKRKCLVYVQSTRKQTNFANVYGWRNFYLGIYTSILWKICLYFVIYQPDFYIFELCTYFVMKNRRLRKLTRAPQTNIEGKRPQPVVCFVSFTSTSFKACQCLSIRHQRVHVRLLPRALAEHLSSKNNGCLWNILVEYIYTQYYTHLSLYWFFSIIWVHFWLWK